MIFYPFVVSFESKQNLKRENKIWILAMLRNYSKLVSHKKLIWYMSNTRKRMMVLNKHNIAFALLKKFQENQQIHLYKNYFWPIIFIK